MLSKDQQRIIYGLNPGDVTADGYAGHFAGQKRCLFRLHHHVISRSGVRYAVSTVGDYIVDGVRLSFDIISEEKFYETMVFSEAMDQNGYVKPKIYLELAKILSEDSVVATINHYRMIESVLDWPTNVGNDE